VSVGIIEPKHFTSMAGRLGSCCIASSYGDNVKVLSRDKWRPARHHEGQQRRDGELMLPEHLMTG
jgi:hypothetical protein